jgi:hypothetical protein
MCLLLVILIGCAAGPKIRPLRGNERITIQTLVENWEDYDVHYSFAPGLSIYTGILFDPKNNGVKIGGSRWTKINDKETLTKVLDGLPKFTYPDKVEGPEGEIYGYIHYLKREPGGVRSQRAVISMADASTMIITFESISTGRGLQRTVR